MAARKIDFLSLAKSRNTTYDYEGRRVSEYDIMRILEAARQAPSFKNTQPWEFIIVRKKENIDRLLKTARYGIYRLEKHPSQPPVLIAAVLRKKYWEGEIGYPRTDKPGIFEAYLSLAMPVLSMAFEAQAVGCASCILNVAESDAFRLLRLKQGDICPLVLAVGYPKKGLDAKKKPRKELFDIIHYEYHGGKREAFYP